MPERTCIGCGRKRSSAELVRLAACGDRVFLDLERTAPGRGAWLCPSTACLDRALKKRAHIRALRLDPAHAGRSTGRGNGEGRSSMESERMRRQFEELIGEDTSGQGPGL